MGGRMKFRKKAYRLRAVAGVWIASMIVLIVAMLGWAMDTSYVAYVAQQLQVAADAAALAGAAEAKTDLPLARLRAQATHGCFSCINRDVIAESTDRFDSHAFVVSMTTHRAVNGPLFTNFPPHLKRTK